MRYTQTMDEPDKKPSGVPTWFLVVIAAGVLLIAGAVAANAWTNHESKNRGWKPEGCSSTYNCD